MAYWLLKTEPGTYAWNDLVRAGKTTWDGVTNATALKNIRSMKKGDEVLIYHSGPERCAVGIAQVTTDPHRDPKQADERLAVIEIKPLRKLARPVTLDTIKADPRFAGWDLLRISRLSVVSVPPAMWKRLEELGCGDQMILRDRRS